MLTVRSSIPLIFGRIQGLIRSLYDLEGCVIQIKGKGAQLTMAESQEQRSIYIAQSSALDHAWLRLSIVDLPGLLLRHWLEYLALRVVLTTQRQRSELTPPRAIPLHGVRMDGDANIPEISREVIETNRE